MAAPSDWLAPALSGVTTLLTGVLGYFGIRLHNKVDTLEKDAKEAITREELMQHMEIIRQERQRMHVENQGLLQQIFGKLDDHSALKEKLENMLREIGSHDTGIRGELHQHSNLLARHEFELETLRKKRP